MLELRLDNLPIEKLEAMKAQILNDKAHWLSCQDGSYEMALAHSPYYKILDEIESRETL